MEDKEPSFSEANSLRCHYKLIGEELKNFDSISVSFFSSFSEFREGVAFVPVEVLESYFDDLLDLEVSEQTLNISNNKTVLLSNLTVILGIISAFLVGFYTASSLNSILFASFIALCVASPFLAFLVFMPKLGNARRMRFARIVSKEIARRRGSDEDGINRRRLLIDKILLRNYSLQGFATSSKVTYKKVYWH